MALFGAERWYLPLSRLWAAANAAGEDVALFRDNIGAPLADLRSADRLRGVLGRHTRVRLQGDAARQDWENAVFGAQDGVLTTVGVVSSIFGAHANNTILLLAGIASAFAGMVAMTAGSYLSSKAAHEV